MEKSLPRRHFRHRLNRTNNLHLSFLGSVCHYRKKQILVCSQTFLLDVGCVFAGSLLSLILDIENLKFGGEINKNGLVSSLDPVIVIYRYRYIQS